MEPKSKNVVVLSASVDGAEQETGEYIANKLSYYFHLDSVDVVDRSQIHAFEIAFELNGRRVFSPKETHLLNEKLKGDYYILSHIKRLNPTEDEYEFSIKVLDPSFKLLKVHYTTFKLDEYSFYDDLSRGLEKVVWYKKWF